MKLAFLGLGVMGYPMAGYLSKNDTYEVCVYNRTKSKAAAWCDEYRGQIADTPQQAVKDADIVFACVGNDDDLRSVVLGDAGALSGMKAGSLFVDHTTASAKVARELADIAAKQQIGFVDAPVSGGQAGAENGALTIMCGGTVADYKRAEPVMDHYAKASKLMGDVGAGQLTKMVNQICIAGLVQGLAEGVHFAKKAGLDTDAVFDAISKGAAGSWQMENRHHTMAKGEFDFGFAVDWMRKDLGIVLEQAQSIDAKLPVTALVDQFYALVQGKGGHRWDTSSLLTVLDD